MKIIHNINKAERITKSDSCPTLCASNSVPSSPSQAGVVAQCVPLPGHRSVSTNGTEMGRAVPQRVAAMWWAAAVFWLQILLLPQRSSLLDCSRGNRYVSGFRTGSKQKLKRERSPRGFLQVRKVMLSSAEWGLGMSGAAARSPAAEMDAVLPAISWTGSTLGCPNSCPSTSSPPLTLSGWCCHAWPLSCEVLSPLLFAKCSCAHVVFNCMLIPVQYSQLKSSKANLQVLLPLIAKSKL